MEDMRALFYLAFDKATAGVTGLVLGTTLKIL